VIRTRFCCTRGVCAHGGEVFYRVRARDARRRVMRGEYRDFLDAAGYIVPTSGLVESLTVQHTRRGLQNNDSPVRGRFLGYDSIKKRSSCEAA
jgi:hypothetical protein